MDSPGTVLIAAEAGVEWSATTDILANEYGYRVLIARSPAHAASTLKHVHVDLVIADDGADAIDYEPNRRSGGARVSPDLTPPNPNIDPRNQYVQLRKGGLNVETLFTRAAPHQALHPLHLDDSLTRNRAAAALRLMPSRTTASSDRSRKSCK